MSLIGMAVAGADPHIAEVAVRVLRRIVDSLHAVAVHAGGETVFAFAAGPHLADELAAFGADREDDEDDGVAESDGRRVFDVLDELAALEGFPVPAWTPPDEVGAGAGVPEVDLVAGYWPDLSLGGRLNL